jgi:peptidyl-prolyl cis-trans isomerase B (cyclophilin B)
MPARLLSIAAVALGLLVAGCGDDDEDETAATEPPATERPATERPATVAGSCRDVEQPAAREPGGLRKPREKLDPAKTYDVTLETSCGDITIRLDVKTSPGTTASFVSLVRKEFFDGTTFHRIVPGFVIQGGDPTATGSGGPGYSTRDEPPQDTTYPKGAVAMAKAGQEPPGTAGSQFYIVTGSAPLPPEYAVLGRVVKGLEVAERIGELGDPNTGEAGTPLRPVVIEEAKLAVS